MSGPYWNKGINKYLIWNDWFVILKNKKDPKMTRKFNINFSDNTMLFLNKKHMELIQKMKSDMPDGFKHIPDTKPDELTEDKRKEWITNGEWTLHLHYSQTYGYGEWSSDELVKWDKYDENIEIENPPDIMRSDRVSKYSCSKFVVECKSGEKHVLMRPKFDKQWDYLKWYLPPVSDGPTDGPSDEPIDGPTDKPNDSDVTEPPVVSQVKKTQSKVMKSKSKKPILDQDKIENIMSKNTND